MSDQTTAPEKKTRKPRTPKPVNEHVASLKRVTNAAVLLAKAVEGLTETEVSQASALAFPQVGFPQTA